MPSTEYTSHIHGAAPIYIEYPSATTGHSPTYTQNPSYIEGTTPPLSAARVPVKNWVGDLPTRMDSDTVTFTMTADKKRLVEVEEELRRLRSLPTGTRKKYIIQRIFKEE